MNYFRRTLPSLDALVYFESAARHLNFTHSAAELNVSQVAVSKRIRELEQRLGTPLFERLGRRLALTARGKVLAEKTSVGLAFLEEAIQAAKQRSDVPRQVVTIAANENVNFFWLAPLMREFQLLGKDVVISVMTANNVTDVINKNTDLAVFYGKTAPKGWRVHASFPELLIPVSAGSYLERLKGKPAEKATLLDYSKESPDWMNWQSLSQETLRSWFAGSTRQPCASYIQSVTLAAEGRGIAMGALPLLQRELDLGELVQLDSEPIVSGHQYFVATPESRQVTSGTQDIISFLAVA